MRHALLALAATSLVAGTAHADPTQWSANGHYYEFYNADVTWAEALELAASKTWNGCRVTATVTSPEENRFVSVDIGLYQLGWLGASDNGLESRWTWRDGPEKGQALTWFSWTANEPNNCCTGGENYLQTNWLWAGEWNDHGGPAMSGQLNGYFVEYSAPIAAVPEPASWGLLLMGLAGIGALVMRRRH